MSGKMFSQLESIAQRKFTNFRGVLPLWLLSRRRPAIRIRVLAGRICNRHSRKDWKLLFTMSTSEAGSTQSFYENAEKLF